ARSARRKSAKDAKKEIEKSVNDKFKKKSVSLARESGVSGNECLTDPPLSRASPHPHLIAIRLEI
ncbi:hypothetical protein, partial [Pseudomonas sp.]|uniref:hypothetical protein n=1 Tax=Pseudomonas sp. TaxID=306 RepID=UPI002355E9B8